MKNIKKTKREAVGLGADENFPQVIANLGHALHGLRVSQSVTQTELARRIQLLTGSQVDQGTLSRIERGMDRSLDWHELYAACRVLNVSTDFLFSYALNLTRKEAIAARGASFEHELLKEIKKSRAATPECFYPGRENIFYHARRRILLGEIANGTVLDTSSVATEYDTSVNEVVAAFALLRAEGCVDLLSAHKCVVPSYDVTHMVAVAGQRIALERQAARRLAAGDHKDEGLRRLKANHKEMVKLSGPLRRSSRSATYSSWKAKFVDLDFKFHQAMLEYAGMSHASEELARLMVQILVGTQTMTLAVRPSEVIDEHEKIIRAIGSGDSANINKAILGHMVGNAAQWSRIVQDRLSIDASGSEHAEVECVRHAAFRERVTEAANSATLNE